VPALFAPAYVGGRTAAEHWDLTEQIFKDILVMTTQPVRQKNQERHGTHFSLKHIDERKLFGTKSIWRHRTRVPVSDVHRTVVDMIDDPSLGGGIQHVADCFATYLRREDRDDEKLVEYAVCLGNGAVFKRLGFLAEHAANGAGAALASRCEDHLSGGHAKLDPGQDNPHLVTKWRLRVPQRWARAKTP
jgi:predicted transcriptional regulator of viral defense system